MVKKGIAVLSAAVMTSVILFFGLAYAAAPSSDAPLKSVGDIIIWFNGVADAMQVIFWIAAVASGIYAGFLYIMANAEPEKLTKAKWQFIYTLVATAMAILAFGIPKLVESILNIGK